MSVNSNRSKVNKMAATILISGANRGKGISCVESPSSKADPQFP